MLKSRSLDQWVGEGGLGNKPDHLEKMLASMNAQIISSETTRIRSAEPQQLAEMAKKVWEPRLPVVFLTNTNQELYGELVKKLENNYAKGDNKYPRSRAEAIALLINYRTRIRS